jgi:hypothetical protein
VFGSESGSTGEDVVTKDPSAQASVEPKLEPITIQYAFNGLCTMRNGETQSRWGAAQLGLVLNIPALATALFRLAQLPSGPELYLILIGSLFLVATDVFWRAILRRHEIFLEYWNEKLEELERKHGIEGGMTIFSSTDYLRMRHAGVRFRGGLQWIALTCIVLWGVISAGAFLMAFVVPR